jgi:hypothetical protein
MEHQKAGPVLLIFLALGLVVAGLVVIVLGVTGHFLPHDEAYLGMTARELCELHECRIVHFMIHDRVSFGGYCWLAQQRAAWAWWTLLVSGIAGFLSFFTYLGYGYLDTWHGLAWLGLLPLFIGGMSLSRPRECRLRAPAPRGRLLLLATAVGLVGGGLTIMVVGMTCVFVPQDLAYMDLNVEDLEALNPRLVPLIAHDRAGFGGAVCCCGITLLLCLWFGQPPRWLLALVGIVGFGTAIGIHPAIGYTDVVHLGPAVLGAVSYLAGACLFQHRP